MKISEMITEDMVRGIIPEAKRHEFLGIQNKDYDGHTQYLAFKEHEYGGDRCPAFTIPLAQFLFVDAWDYFERRGWSIQSSYTTIFTNYNNDFRGEFCIDKTGRYIGNNVYPSRLHAMAAAAVFMYNCEEEKNDETE